MSRASSTPSTRACRVRRHVFGRAREGYTTLACSPDLSVAERHELECFEFGETVEWGGDPGSLEDLRFLLRPVTAGIALTRVSPGPPDPSRRPTLLMHSLLFERGDAALVASQLAGLLRNSKLFDFAGGESDPLEFTVDTTPSAPVRPDLFEMSQTAQSRRGVCVIPLANTSFGEVTALVTRIYAERGSLPRVVYRPGSDELECDVMVVDEHCRRGNGSQLRIIYPEGRSESARSSARRSSGPAFDARAVVVPKGLTTQARWTDDMESSMSIGEKALAAAQVATLLLVAVLVGILMLADSREQRAIELTKDRHSEALAAIAKAGSGAEGRLAALAKKLEEIAGLEQQGANAAKEHREGFDAKFATLIERIEAIEKAGVKANQIGRDVTEQLGEFKQQLEQLSTANQAKSASESSGLAASEESLRNLNTKLGALQTPLQTIQQDMATLSTHTKGLREVWEKWEKEKWDKSVTEGFKVKK